MVTFKQKILLVFCSTIFLMSMTSLYSVDTINVQSVTGNWTNAIGEGNNGSISNFSGGGTNEIHWGFQATQNGNSGYKFVGNAPPVYSVNLGSPFAIGTFSHINFPVTGNLLTSVDLNVNMQLSINNVINNFTGIYHFLHDETTNTGGGGCCNDHVAFQNNASQLGLVNIGGVNYTIALLGFKTTVDGPLLSDFSTVENQVNNATLYAEIVRPEVLAPEPSTYAILVGGLAVCLLVHRKRSMAKNKP